MEVGELRNTAHSGSDFLNCNTFGVLVFKSFGDQDEAVDITGDGDTHRTPLAAAGATGVGTPPKAVAGSTIAPRVGVDNIAYRLREQQTTSIGRRTVPQLVAGEDGSDASVPKVSVEGTSKQSDFHEQMSAKSSGSCVRQLELMQQQSKGKTPETEPSTSAPAKRTDVASDMTGHKNRAVAPTMRREDSALKRKEGEGREKSPAVMVRGKRPRVLRFDDDSYEELFERVLAFNDGIRNPKTRMPTPAEKQSVWQWITCTKCKKIQLVNADEDLDISSWCCEKNTGNPKYASCSAPQEKGDCCKVEADALEEIQEAPNYPNDLERKKRAQRKMVWVKGQVDGKHVWWPGLTVKVVPAAIQKIIDEAAHDPGRAVRLSHPQDFEQYQVLRKSSLKPFFMRVYRNSSSHPDFKVAVAETDQYFADPDMEEFFEFITGSKSETRQNAADDIAKWLLEDVPHGRHMDVKPSEIVEASVRSKAAEDGGTEELCCEKLVLDLEILPTKKPIENEDATKELHVQDGTVSLGKEIKKYSTGPSLYECIIYKVGKANIRKRSSTGLKFESLDQDHGEFAKRLRDTWLWEYDGEKPMPVYLTSRFVSGCILEAQGKAVNWASELTPSVRNELKQIGVKMLERFSPRVLKLIDR